MGARNDDVAGRVHVIERRELHVEVRADVGEAANLQLPRRIDRRRSLRAAQVIDDDPQVGHRRAKRLHLVFGFLSPRLMMSSVMPRRARSRRLA